MEERIAKFVGTEEAILYSYDVATPSSIVPAFAKRGDIVICDEAVCYPLMNGIVLSRSTMYSYKHNDMKDLERVLKEVRTATTIISTTTTATAVIYCSHFAEHQ